MGDSCCTMPSNASEKKRTVCPECSNKGKSVETRTLHYLVKGKFQKSIVPEESYYFCAIPNCPIVYYSSNHHVFTKDEIRVPVGQKEKENPQLCYCFNFFTSDILEEIKATGETTILDFIKGKVKEKLCACEIMNPEGRCCLGNIGLVIKKATSR